MASGYTACPCCGMDTVSDNTEKPELCSDCESANCNDGGTDPCLCEDEDGEEDLHPAGSSPESPRGVTTSWPSHQPGTLGGICPSCPTK